MLTYIAIVWSEPPYSLFYKYCAKPFFMVISEVKT